MNKAFTLIEILVVIVIIGILSAFIIVGMAGVSEKATIAKGQAFSSSLKNSLMLNLVSEWRMDDASGTTVKDYWDSNNGTWSGPAGSYTSPSWRTASECVSGGCLAFDGTDDYVDSTITTAFGTGDYTISLWFKEAGASFYMISPSTNVTMDYPFPHIRAHYAANQIWIQKSASGGTASIPYTPDSAWHHLVVIRASGILSVYLDGASKTVTGATTQNGYNFTAATFNMGDFYYSGTRYYSAGSMDDVRVYNMALPTSQIQQNYYAGLNRLLAGQSIDSREYVKRLALEEN